MLTTRGATLEYATFGRLLVDIHLDICLRVSQDDINQMHMSSKNDAQGENELDTWPGHHWRMSVPVVHTMLLHASMSTKSGLPFDDFSRRISLSLHWPPSWLACGALKLGRSVWFCSVTCGYAPPPPWELLQWSFHGLVFESLLHYHSN